MGAITEIVTAAASHDLTTTERVLLSLGDDADSALIDALIPEASRIVVDYCDRVFISERVKESFAGNNSRKALLSRTPITAIHGFEVDGEAQTDSPEIDAPDAGVIWYDSGFPGPTRINVSVRPEIRGQRIYAVEYTGGYVLAEGSTRTLPFSIEHACIEIVKLAYASACRDPAVSSQTVGGFVSEVYQTGFPARVRAILDPWRRPC